MEKTTFTAMWNFQFYICINPFPRTDTVFSLVKGCQFTSHPSSLERLAGPLPPQNKEGGTEYSDIGPRIITAIEALQILHFTCTPLSPMPKETV